MLNGANLTGANLKNALTSSTFALSMLDSSTIYNQWTQFSPGFDPVAAGLTLVESPLGDFDANDALDAADIDVLVAAIRGFPRPQIPWWLPQDMLDVNRDSMVDMEDHRVWVKDLRYTWFGDADLDGEFNSADFVQVFAVGKYEMQEYSGWSEGDWSGDGVFDSGDFVTAFADGGYEVGPRTAAAVVPEPSGWLLGLAGLAGQAVLRLGRRQCAGAAAP